MRGRTIAGWAMAAALTVAALSALAQQDEGPILRPKKPVAKPAGPTLLVLCDLACVWKLDGTDQGRIEANGSAKAKVELGQHLVVAVTEDGADQVKQLVKVEEKGQTVISLELKPVRDARLRAEQQARNHTEPPAPAKPAETEPPAPAKPAEKVVPDAAPIGPQERAKIAREEAAGVWTDPATGLMWAKKDNGDYVTRRQADDYCNTLQLAGHSDWRLPRIEELQGISNKSGNESKLDPESIKHIAGKVFSRHGEKIPPVKGDLQLSSNWAWSSSMGNSASEAWDFYFYSGKRYSYNINSRDGNALCVRGSK
jgi:hypothetical protein